MKRHSIFSRIVAFFLFGAVLPCVAVLKLSTPVFSLYPSQIKITNQVLDPVDPNDEFTFHVKVWSEIDVPSFEINWNYTEKDFVYQCDKEPDAPDMDVNIAAHANVYELSINPSMTSANLGIKLSDFVDGPIMPNSPLELVSNMPYGKIILAPTVDRTRANIDCMPDGGIIGGNKQVFYEVELGTLFFGFDNHLYLVKGLSIIELTQGRDYIIDENGTFYFKLAEGYDENKLFNLIKNLEHLDVDGKQHRLTSKSFTSPTERGSASFEGGVARLYLNLNIDYDGITAINDSTYSFTLRAGESKTISVGRNFYYIEELPRNGYDFISVDGINNPIVEGQLEDAVNIIREYQYLNIKKINVEPEPEPEPEPEEEIIVPNTGTFTGKTPGAIEIAASVFGTFLGALIIALATRSHHKKINFNKR